MKPVWYGLYERIARANGLTSHGRRKLRREMRSDLRDNLRKARAALAPYAGKPLTVELRDQMKKDLAAAFAPPEPIEINVTFSDGKILHCSASGAISGFRSASTP
jgi:hypothetical protein